MTAGPPPLFGRLPPQVFAEILAGVRAAERRAAADPTMPRVIDLGRGNPDVGPPERALAALRAETYSGYPPFLGLPVLREAIAAHYAEEYGVALDPEREVVVLPGTKTGIMLLALACAGPGDAIALPDPGYPDYRSGVALAGAREVVLPLDPTAGFAADLDAVAAADPRLVVLNYPSNPCAVCEPPGAFEAAVADAARRGSVLLNDLAYGFLAFDGRRARSLLATPGARDVAAVELWSASKIYGMAGWRIGAAVGDATIIARLQELLEHLFVGVYTGLQHGLVAALTGEQDDVAARRATYAARRDRLAAAIPGLTAPEGTFYAWWRPPAGIDATVLLERHGVAVAPGEGFGARGDGWVRLSLAAADTDLDEGAARIAAAVAAHGG